MTIRLAVLLSGAGTTLENLLHEIDTGRLDARVAVVLSSRADAFGLERAKRRGIPVEVVSSKDFLRRDTLGMESGAGRRMPDWTAMSRRITEVLRPHAPELICLAGFMCRYLLPPEWRGRVMNIHPALLPAFGGEGLYGIRVHEAVRASGVKITGCTVHFVDDDYDSGPIIAQRACPVHDADSAEDIAARVFEEECAAYPEAIRFFAEGRLTIDGRVVHVQE